MSSSKTLLTCAEIERLEGVSKTHFLNDNAIRINKSLGDAVGLRNIGVHLISVAPGHQSTELHKHYCEEECVYVLSGQATAVIGTERHRINAGDFMGFPADTAAHTIVNDSDEMLVCLVIGQRLANDVCDYPGQRKRLFRNNGVWDLVAIDDITRIER